MFVVILIWRVCMLRLHGILLCCILFQCSAIVNGDSTVSAADDTGNIGGRLRVSSLCEFARGNRGLYDAWRVAIEETLGGKITPLEELVLLLNDTFFMENVFQPASAKELFENCGAFQNEDYNKCFNSLERFAGEDAKRSVALIALLSSHRLFKNGRFKKEDMQMMIKRLNAIPKESVAAYAKVSGLDRFQAALFLAESDMLFTEKGFDSKSFEELVTSMNHRESRKR
jgi:hypothetical protein